jgi:hypothetical protein
MGVLVTQLKSFKVFLGFDWLQAVNPKVDWRRWELSTKEEEKVLPMQSAMDGCPDYKKEFPQVFQRKPLRNCPLNGNGTMQSTYLTEQNHLGGGATPSHRRKTRP